MREAERIFIQMSGKKKRLPIGIDSFEKLRCHKKQCQAMLEEEKLAAEADRTAEV